MSVPMTVQALISRSGTIACSLGAIGAIWGSLAFVVFRRFTNRALLRKAFNRIYAHLLEIRLFSDELSLVWEAQKALLIENLRFLALIARPVIILAVPFTLLFPLLDAVYGRAPLEIGRSALITAQLKNEIPGEARYILQTPPGIAVETLSIRDFADRQITWRVRPLIPVRGTLRLTLPDGVTTRPIGAGPSTLSPNRVRESSPGGAAWIEIDYPEAEVAIAGLSLPWLAWFLVISAASATVLTFRPKRGRL